MNFLDVIEKVVNLIPHVMQAFQHMLEAIGNLFDKLGQTKSTEVTQEAQEIALSVEAKPQIASDWFKQMYPTIDSLLLVWPKLPCLMYVAHNVSADQNVDLHTAITAAQLAANQIKFG